MGAKLEQLKNTLDSSLAGKIVSLSESLGELTLVVEAKDYAATARWLRDDPAVRFEELIDLCGVDYSGFGEGGWKGRRFAVVSHLLSRWSTHSPAYGPTPTGTSARPSTCLESCLPGTPICGASSPITASSATPSARISRSRATSRCDTTRSRSASSTSR